MLKKCNVSSIFCWKSLLSSLPFFKLSFKVSLIGHLTKKIELNPDCPQNGLQDWLTTAHLVQIARNPSLDENLQGLWVGSDSENETNRWPICWILLPAEASSSTSSSSNLPSAAACKMSCSGPGKALRLKQSSLSSVEFELPLALIMCFSHLQSSP